MSLQYIITFLLNKKILEKKSKDNWISVKYKNIYIEGKEKYTYQKINFLFFGAILSQKLSFDFFQ